MGRPVSSDLEKLLQMSACSSHTTLDLYLQDSSELHFATDTFVIDAIGYSPELRQTDEIKQTIFVPPDRVNVLVQNVDKQFGATVAAEDLVKAEAVVGRYYRDPAGAESPVWEELFRGEVRPVSLDEREARLEVLHDLAAAGFCVADWTLAENCQFVFKHAATCGYAGGLPTCNKKRKSEAGCEGRANDHHYGGMEYPDIQKAAAPTGGGGGGGHNTCPRVDQWVPAAAADGTICPIQAGTVEHGDWLYNPLSETFSKVRSARIVKGQSIWRMASTAGVSGYSSGTHPVFPFREHPSGIRVDEVEEGGPLLLWSHAKGLFNHAVKIVGEMGETGDVVLIELEDGHVYAYGDSPETYIVCHNSKDPNA